MRGRNPIAVGLGVVAWILLCGSLTLLCGSGAERYPIQNEPDYDKTMLLAALACFGAAGVIALLLRLAGQGRPGEESSLGGLTFLYGTLLIAAVAGLVIDILR